MSITIELAMFTLAVVGGILTGMFTLFKILLAIKEQVSEIKDMITSKDTIALMIETCVIKQLETHRNSCTNFNRRHSD